MKSALRVAIVIGAGLVLEGCCCFGGPKSSSGPVAVSTPVAPGMGQPVPPIAEAPAQVPSGATPPGGFTGMQVPTVAMPYAANDWVWAATSNTPDWSRWTFGRARFIGAEGNHAKVRSMQERLTPSAFVSAAVPPAALAPGAPVLYNTAIPIYGRVVSVAGAQAQVANGMAATYRTVPRDVATLLAIQPNTWTPGHPAAIAVGTNRYACILVAATAEKVWGVCSGRLREGARADARLIDPTAHLASGASVLAQSMSSIGEANMGPARVTAVLNDGNAYTVTTTGGRTFDAPWPMVMAAP